MEDPQRALFLAIPENIYFEEMEEEELVQLVVKNRNVHFFVFNVDTKTIIKWIK